MTYDTSDPERLLRRLRDESIELILTKGLFSPEFQAWHAAALAVLREQFGENDSLYQEFKGLQFEWPLKWIEEAYQQQTQYLKDPDTTIDTSYKNAPAEFREMARRAMRDTLANVPPERRALFETVAGALEADVSISVGT